jgi:hypothetical protein
MQIKTKVHAGGRCDPTGTSPAPAPNPKLPPGYQLP